MVPATRLQLPPAYLRASAAARNPARPTTTPVAHQLPAWETERLQRLLEHSASFIENPQGNGGEEEEINSATSVTSQLTQRFDRIEA